jgi:hypothetical protein
MDASCFTIAVETMASQYARAGLDRVAECLLEHGYIVIRWQGPYARRFKFVASAVPKCDAAVIWNGLKPRYRYPVKALQGRQIPFLVMEVGWHPQHWTYQLDSHGINCGASWVKDLLSRDFPRTSPIVIKQQASDLLVVMQNDGDSQISHYSPYFGRMSEFLGFLVEASHLPLRVRFHPRHPPGFGLRRLIRKHQHRLAIDHSPSFSEALVHAKAVACVNSSAGVEAMRLRVPVLCFGDSIYRVPGAVYCLDNNHAETNRVTRELSEGHCDLDDGAIEAVASTIESHQLSLEKLPLSVTAMIDSLLKIRGATKDQHDALTKKS